MSATERAVEQAQENLRLQRLRYSEGVGTATEVLDAVSLATTAEQNFLNARYDVTEARRVWASPSAMISSLSGAATN